MSYDFVLFSESTIFSQVCVVVYSPPRIMSENAEIFTVKFVFVIETCYFGLLSVEESGLELRVRNENLIFLFLNQNVCCGYSKEPSQ